MLIDLQLQADVVQDTPLVLIVRPCLHYTFALNYRCSLVSELKLHLEEILFHLLSHCLAMILHTVRIIRSIISILKRIPPEQLVIARFSLSFPAKSFVSIISTFLKFMSRLLYSIPQTLLNFMHPRGTSYYYTLHFVFTSKNHTLDTLHIHTMRIARTKLSYRTTVI